MSKSDKPSSSSDGTKADPRFSVDELRAACATELPFEGAHQAASALHGWSLHLHATGKAMRLSREDYLKAVEAGLKPVPNKPYDPALSAHLAPRS